jgi:hypothetical protein
VDDSLRELIDSWVRINRGYGVGKISFGLMDSNWTNMLKLKEEHGSYIEIVQLETDTGKACKMLNLKGDRVGRCLGSHLNNIFGAFSLLEKVSANDWYLF